MTFYATNSEILRILETGLPKEYEPYSLWWKQWVGSGRTGEWISGESNLSELMRLIEKGVDQFFIRSKCLTPGEPPATSAPLHRTWAASGFVVLQIGGLNGQSYLPCDIGIVDKVVQENTEEIFNHSDYKKIFLALKRKLIKYIKANSFEGSFPRGFVFDHSIPATRESIEAILSVANSD